MALPEEFAKFILRTIFDLTEKSVSKIYKNVPIYRYPRDVGNFTRWGAALLGLSVFADEPNLLADAIDKFTHLGEPSHCEAGTYLFSSLAHTLIACGPEEILNPVSYLMEGRCQIEFAFRKGGIDDLCCVCFTVILKTQKAFLEAHKHKDVIKGFLLQVSKGEDFEHLFKFLREKAQNEKEDYLCGLKSALNINGETYDEEIVDIGELKWRLRALMMNFVSELHCFSQGCDVEHRMEELYQEVLKAEGYSSEQAMMELKGVIPSVILEQFRRSADAAHVAGSESADNWTVWGSALLGISIQNGGKGLQASVDKLDRALSLDGARTDTLCYASCAYGSLYCLSFGSPESEWYLNNAKTCIAKAVGQDPDEDLFTRCQAFIDSLEAIMVSGNKELRKEKRKYGDAFF